MTQHPAQPGLESTAPLPKTAPAINPPRWRGRKTAVAAALAIGLSSAGAVAAAATVEQGGAGREGGGPGGGPGPGGMPGQNQHPQSPQNQDGLQNQQGPGGQMGTPPGGAGSNQQDTPPAPDRSPTSDSDTPTT